MLTGTKWMRWRKRSSSSRLYNACNLHASLFVEGKRKEAPKRGIEPRSSA